MVIDCFVSTCQLENKKELILIQAGVLGSGHSKGMWPEEEECVERMWRQPGGSTGKESTAVCKDVLQ